MARVTEAEVRQIISTDLDPIDNFINTANIIVNANLAENSSCALSEDELKQIELYLSAHLIALTDGTARQSTSEKLGDASVSYGGSLGEGLNYTQYGQTVKMLDRCGVLASLGKRQVIWSVV